MTAWGRTGRVTLGKKRTPSIDAERRVKVDGTVVGAIFYPRGEGSFPHFGAVTGINHDYDYTEGLPSLDAAILWVLRRVDPALWRQERGAWLVRKRKPGEGIADGWHFPGPREYNPWFPWLLVDPNGVSRDACADIPTAHRYVTEYAKVATR